MLTLTDGTTVSITGYDCSPDQAERFASNFRAVWQKLAEVVRVILDRHWTRNGFAVVLTEPAPTWGRESGFASARPDGAGIHCWSKVLERIPEDYLQTDLAYELGHITFIILGEPHHAAGRCGDGEWLIAALQETRGLDQTASKLWQLENIENRNGVLSWKAAPEPEEECASRAAGYRMGFERMATRREEFRKAAGLYFRIAAGTCSAEITEIARNDPDRLGRILRGQEPEPAPHTKE